MNPGVDATATSGRRPSAAEVAQLLPRYWQAQIIGVATRLRIADHLEAGPRTAGELAEATGAHQGALGRFLRACRTLGIVRELPAGRYEVTPLGSLLGSAPPSLRNVALAYTAPGQWLPWGRLYDAVMTGGPVAEAALGMPLYEYYEKHPEEGAQFAATMGDLAADAAEAFVRNYDLTPFRRIIDIGGSHGVLLSRVLAEAPQASGVLFDLPEVIEQARARMGGSGLAGRLEFAVGDFFERIPGGGDLYLAKQVFCDWPDEQVVEILSVIRRNAPGTSRLVVIDCLYPMEHDSERGHSLHIMDLGVLVTNGGQVRSVDDYRMLMNRAGYRLERVQSVPGALLGMDWKLLEAVPARDRGGEEPGA